MSEWQPIETAPKDGTRIWVWNGEHYGIAEWCSPGWAGKPFWFIEWATSDYTEYGETISGIPQVTHWMALSVPSDHIGGER